MEYKIAVVPGDGIGPEVIDQAIKVLNKVGMVYGHQFNYEKHLAGGAAIDAYGECLPQSTLDGCKASDAVLLELSKISANADQEQNSKNGAHDSTCHSDAF